MPRADEVRHESAAPARLPLLALLVAAIPLLSLAAAASPDPWAAAQERFPPLRPYVPAPAPGALRELVAAGRSWVRLGGACRRVVPHPRGSVTDVVLCSGNGSGHYWRRWVELRIGDRLEVSQALLDHGLDRRGDTRHFPAEERVWRALAPVASGEGTLELGAPELLHELSTRCWAASNWSATCPDGTRRECRICKQLRLLGGKERAAHVYGSLKIVADLDKPCDAPCEEGMPEAETEQLNRLLTGRRFAWKQAPAAVLHHTRASCEAAEGPDLLPELPPCLEPPLP